MDDFSTAATAVATRTSSTPEAGQVWSATVLDADGTAVGVVEATCTGLFTTHGLAAISEELMCRGLMVGTFVQDSEERVDREGGRGDRDGYGQPRAARVAAFPKFPGHPVWALSPRSRG